jgi:photosystem II stability/assembly factor-like uncharacterized protein
MVLFRALLPPGVAFQSVNDSETASRAHPLRRAPVMPPCVLRGQWVQVSGASGNDDSPFVFSGIYVFAGSEDGVLISSDSGSTWRVAGLSNYWIVNVCADGKYVFAVTEEDTIFRSTDTGKSWSTLSSSSGLDIEPICANESKLFGISNAGGVFISTNEGSSWDSTAIKGSDIGIIQANGSDVYAAPYVTSFDSAGILHSTDNGETWIAEYTGFSDTYIESFAFSGSNIFAAFSATAGDGILLSSNNGATWSRVDGGLPISGFAIPFFLAAIGQNVFATMEQGGIFLSTNNGQSWHSIDSELYTQYIYFPGIAGSELLVGTSNGIWRRPLSQIIPQSAVAEVIASKHEILTYPNPVSQSTQITFTLPEASEVTLTITDAAGRETPLLRSAWFPAGEHEIAWDASNYPSGVYLCRLSSGGESVTERMVVLK